MIRKTWWSTVWSQKVSFFLLLLSVELSVVLLQCVFWHRTFSSVWSGQKEKRGGERTREGEKAREGKASSSTIDLCWTNSEQMALCVCDTLPPTLLIDSLFVTIVIDYPAQEILYNKQQTTKYKQVRMWSSMPLHTCNFWTVILIAWVKKGSYHSV